MGARSVKYQLSQMQPNTNKAPVRIKKHPDPESGTVTGPYDQDRHGQSRRYQSWAMVLEKRKNERMLSVSP